MYSRLKPLLARAARSVSAPGKLRTTLSWCVALLVIYLIFRWIDPRSTLRQIRSVTPGPLAWCVLFLLAGLAARWVKWLIVLRSEHAIMEMTTLFFVTKLAGSMLPGRLGDMAPLARGRYRTRKMAAFLIADRLFETYATLFLGALGFLAIGLADRRIRLAWLAVVLVVSAVFFALLYRNLWSRLKGWCDACSASLAPPKQTCYEGARRPRKTRSSVLKNPLCLRALVAAAKLLDLFVRLSEGLRALGGRFPILMILTFIATALDFISVKFLYCSLGYDMSLYLVAAVWCTIGLASVIAFTPGGLGLADAPGMYICVQYGVPEAVVGAGFVLGRAVNTLVPWFAFLIYWITRRAYGRKCKQ